MEPTWKAPRMDEFLTSLGMNRRPAIENLRCLNEPFGCGRQITKEEMRGWPALALREYPIVGLCRECQDVAFADPDADPSSPPVCTCDEPCCSVDVGVGPLMTCGSQHCAVHGTDSEPEDRA